MSILRYCIAVCCLSSILVLCNCGTVKSSSSPPPPDVNVIDHIVFLAQENRSFDHYFGAMRQYWAQNFFA